jgi:hypothetical protein
MLLVTSGLWVLSTREYLVLPSFPVTYLTDVVLHTLVLPVSAVGCPTR